MPEQTSITGGEKNFLASFTFFQIVLAVVVSVACAAPQFIADTYEVQEAKRQFAAAYNAAARAAAVASPAQVTLTH